jgi:catechol 2,3-dioxygenase-like lactoylglutathione lyase family enzyme
VDVLSSRILLRPGHLDRSCRFYRDVLGLAIYRESGPTDDPGLVFFLGPGLLGVSGVRDRPSRVLSDDDLDPGPGRSRRERPAGRRRSLHRPGARNRALGA